MLSNTLYLDLETTGLSPQRDEVVQLAFLMDPSEKPLLNTLVRPVATKSWPDAELIHGITPDDIKSAPTLMQLTNLLKHLLHDKDVVIYNKNFDARFIPGELSVARSISCCMMEYAHKANGGKRCKLIEAASDVGYNLPENHAHDAFEDIKATRAVWRYLMQTTNPPLFDEQSGEDQWQRLG